MSLSSKKVHEKSSLPRQRAYTGQIGKMIASGDSAAPADESSQHAYGPVTTSARCCSGSQVATSFANSASKHSLSL